MEWWSLFRKVRLVVFAFVAVASLIWAITLSIYLSKQWDHFNTLQRAIVLAQISVSGVTSLLLYLMIVVVFRMWKELLRVVFLVGIHVVTAFLFTIYGAEFSCKIFDTQSTCKIVDLAFLATAWAVTGVLFSYTVYLCVMSRVSRPLPLLTPNELLITSTPSLSRSPSKSSVTSATRLLSANNSLRVVCSGSPASISSQHSRMVPKRMFVANNAIGSHADEAAGRVRREHHIHTPHRGLSYGAMGMPAHPPPTESSAMQSRFSGSTISSTRPPTVTPPKSSMASPARSFTTEQLTRHASATGSTRLQEMEERDAPRMVPLRPLLLNSNPFMDPISRHGTPETAMTAWSFTSAPANLNYGHVAPYNPLSQGYGNFITPYSTFPGPTVQVPPQLQPGRLADTNPFMSATSAPPSIEPFLTYARSPVGPPPRMHTATPSNASIHSVTPSLHFAFTDSYTHAPPPYAPQQQPHSLLADPRLQPGTLDLPPSAHVRAASDPVWRPYSAGARIEDAGRALPNPYNHGAEIRRYGSVPGGYYRGPAPGYGYAAAGYHYDYNHDGTAAARGVHARGIARGVAAANDATWREMVMRAAAA